MIRNESRYLSPEETAGYLGVSRWTLYKPVWKERLGAKRFGSLIRFDRARVERYMQEHSWSKLSEKCERVVLASYNSAYGNTAEVE